MEQLLVNLKICHCYCIYITGGGVDYNSGPYSVTFLANQTSFSFNIPINNDQILEEDEDFTLTIDPSSLPSRCTVSVPSNTTVIIMDNDRKHILSYSIIVQ